jgi:ribosomal protein S27AE
LNPQAVFNAACLILRPCDSLLNPLRAAKPTPQIASISKFPAQAIGVAARSRVIRKAQHVVIKPLGHDASKAPLVRVSSLACHADNPAHQVKVLQRHVIAAIHEPRNTRQCPRCARGDNIINPFIKNAARQVCGKCPEMVTPDRHPTRAGSIIERPGLCPQGFAARGNPRCGPDRLPRRRALCAGLKHLPHPRRYSAESPAHQRTDPGVAGNIACGLPLRYARPIDRPSACPKRSGARRSSGKTGATGAGNWHRNGPGNLSGG